MRRIYAISLIALAILLTLAGCGGGGHKLPYKTVSPPVLDGLLAPNCAPGDNHSMGQCLPHPPVNSPPRLVTPPGGFRCVDRSNNDPLYGVGAWRAVKAAGFQCAYFKVNESTGFVDWTAARMAHDAKAAGLAVGGYDFQHVCGGGGGGAGAIAEAQLFARLEQKDGLTGPGTLPGAADVEYRGGPPCNERTWELAWRDEATQRLTRPTVTYTGAWYWNPHLGCFWPGGLAWISGYVASLGQVPRPCGRSHIDLWQYSGTGVDREVWLDSAQAYAAFANLPPPPPPPPPPDQHGYRLLWSVERAVVVRYDGARKHPQRYASYLKHTLEPELAKLAAAIYAAAHRHRPPNWGHVVKGHGLGSRGVRYHMLIIRAHGQRVVR